MGSLYGDEFRLSSRGPRPIMLLVIGDLRGTFSCETLELNNIIKWGFLFR